MEPAHELLLVLWAYSRDADSCIESQVEISSMTFLPPLQFGSGQLRWAVSVASRAQLALGS
jgi:hypothetical protein